MSANSNDFLGAFVISCFILMVFGAITFGISYLYNDKIGMDVGVVTGVLGFAGLVILGGGTSLLYF